MEITGVIFYGGKFVIENTYSRNEAWKHFHEWRSAYGISIKNEPELILYTTENLAKVAARFNEDDVNEFYRAISWDTSFCEYRNPIFSEYRRLVWGNLKKECKCLFSFDPMRLERECISYLMWHYDEFADRLPGRSYQKIQDSFSVAQMAEMINGTEWAEQYRQALTIVWVDYLRDRFLQLRQAGLSELKPEEPSATQVIECLEFVHQNGE